MNSIIGNIFPSLYFLPGAVVIFIAVVSFIHYYTFGPKTFKDDGQEKIMWWSKWERIIHIILMITFVIMTLTGLTLSFSAQKTGVGLIDSVRLLHNIGPVFGVATGLMLIIWVRFGIFKRYDLTWFRHLGGYLGYKGSLKAGKFNAGQKVWFWIALICGIMLGVTGGRIEGLQAGPTKDLMLALHLVCASCMLGMFMVHLYMSLFLVKGSFMGIMTGKISKMKAQIMHSEAQLNKTP